MSNATKGFASMDKQRLLLVTSKGGKTAWERGTAHRYDSESAKIASRIKQSKRKGVGSKTATEVNTARDKNSSGN